MIKIDTLLATSQLWEPVFFGPGSLYRLADINGGGGGGGEEVKRRSKSAVTQGKNEKRPRKRSFHINMQNNKYERYSGGGILFYVQSCLQI